MATQNKIIEMIGSIKTIYPYYAKETNVELLVKTWTVLLKDYPDNAVEVAFYKCLQTCKTPPTPADIIERLDEMAKIDTPTNEELWNYFSTDVLRNAERLVSRFGATWRPDGGLTQGEIARKEFSAMYKKLPEEIKQYLGGEGELIRLARATSEELKFERNRFFKTIPTIQKRQETEKLRLSIGDNKLRLGG